jgi:hypothetical protein
VHKGSAGTVASQANSVLTLENDTTAVLQFLTPNTAAAQIRFGDPQDNGAGFIQYDHSDSSLQFGANGPEKMRIDSSGNLLVGTTDAVNTASNLHDGVTIYSDGRTDISKSGGQPLNLRRRGSDGILVAFFKEASGSITNVGAIGSEGGDSLYVEANNSGLRYSSANRVIPCGTNGASRDNIIDLGSAGSRFDDIYATNGTIQTSDRNEKQDIEALSDAEQRVAEAAKGLLRKFRWKSAVEEKGDDARIHFGIIAQDLQDAFTAEGLDAGRYAMFISSTWTDEETGEERTRMGVRYSELLAFIISAI